jgi:hypothetical protein
MLRKIKDYLGIEGVKIELLLNEDNNLKDRVLKGKIIFTSQTPKEVESLHIKLIEKYWRGRGDNTLINEYLLGSIDLDLDLKLDGIQNKSYDFTLAFEMMKSEMDQVEDTNFILMPFIKLAKKLKKVRSEFRVEASAKIKGTKLDPNAIQKVDFK